MVAMRDYHQYTQENGDTFRVPKNRNVDISLFEDVSQVSVSVSYSIANKRRKAKFGKNRYGASNMYMPRLYEILSNRFNNKVPIVDTYLKSLRRRKVGAKIQSLTQDLATELLAEKERLIAAQRKTKKGFFDRRLAVFKTLDAFDTLRDKRLNNFAREIEKEIQTDIVRLLYIGKLPISKKYVEEATVAARERIGYPMPANVVFYATGQLASSIKIHFDIHLSERGAENAV